MDSRPEFTTPDQPLGAPDLPGTPSAHDPASSPAAGLPPVAAALPPAPKKRPWLPVVAGIAALAVVGGAVAVATGILGSGAGAQPSSALPDTTFLYASYDLNPSAAQKANALQFLLKFPSIKEQGIAEKDLQKAVFEAVKGSNNSTFKDVNYDTDIKPWLGDRVAVATVNDASKMPKAGLVLAVKDTAKAKESLAKLSPLAEAECDVADGFAVCAKIGDLAAFRVTDKAKTLANSKQFQADLASVAGDSIGTLWTDLKQSAEFASNMPATGTVSSSLTQLTGRVVAKARFDSATAFVVDAKQLDAKLPVAPKAGTQIATLSGDVIAAMSANGIADQMKALWPEFAKDPTFESTVKGLEQAIGVSLPDDLPKIIGNQTSVAFGGMAADGAALPKLALLTDGSRSATERIASYTLGMVEVEGTDGAVRVGTDATFLGTVANGGLADTPAFKASVTAPDKASQVAFVNLDKLMQVPGVTDSMDAKTKADLAVLSALGITGSMDGATGSSQLKLTVK